MSEIKDNNIRIAKNTLALYARMLFVMVISLYTVRVVLKALGETDYGLYNVVCGIVVMFSFLSRTLASASQRYFAFDIGRSDYSQLQRTFSVTVYLYITIIAIIFILSETIGLWFLNNKMTIPVDRISAAYWIYQFSILSFCVSLITTPYQAIIIAQEKMNLYAIVGVVEAMLLLGVALSINYCTSDKLIFYGGLMLVVTVVVNLIYYVYAKLKYKETKLIHTKDYGLAKEMMSYSGWNIFGALANVVRSQGINILINMFFDPVVNAARALAYQVSNALNSFASNFYTAVRPQVTKYYAKNEYDNTYRLVFSSSKMSYFLILFFATTIIAFSHVILEIWLGTIPPSTELFMALVICTAMIDSLSNPLMTLVQATGRVKNYQVIVGFLLILNLPISYLFLKLGYNAEITMIVSIGISFVLLFVRLLILFKLVKFPVLLYLRRVITYVAISSVSCFMLSFGVKLLYNQVNSNVIITLAFMAFSFVINLITIFFVGFTNDERKSIVGLILSKIK